MGKLTRAIAQKQAGRLQSCPMLAPQSDEGRRELVDCLMRHCQDEEHAARTMTALLDGALRIEGALTAEMARFARDTLDHGQAPVGCERCDAGVTLDGGVQQWFSHVPALSGRGLERCGCPRGRWLTAKDSERVSAAPTTERKAPGKLERPDIRKLASGDQS